MIEVIKRALWAACGAEGLSYSDGSDVGFGQAWVDGGFRVDKFAAAMLAEIEKTHVVISRDDHASLVSDSQRNNDID